MPIQYIGYRAEIICLLCGEEVDDIGISKEGSLGALESIPFLQMRCEKSGSEFRSHRICDLLIVKLAKLTNRSFPNAQQSEDLLMFKVAELENLISSLRPVVTDTSFALGILYKE